MIVADTSALVSLATAEVVKLVFEEFDCHTTETVVDELRATADYEDVSGDGAQTVLEQLEAMTIHTVDSPTFESSRIDAGEGSCVALARRSDADFLLTDDLRALPELQTVVSSQVAISPIVLEALVRRDVLTRERAKERVQQIAKNRDWLESPIYRRAQSFIEE